MKTMECIINQNHPKIKELMKRSPSYYKILQIIAFCCQDKRREIDWNNGHHTYHLEAGQGLMLAPNDYPFYVPRQQVTNALKALKRTYCVLDTNYTPTANGRSVVTFTDPTIFKFD